MGAFMPENYIQLDVKEIKEDWVNCNMFTGQRCVKVFMHISAYEDLKNDGFFIRQGEDPDSANVLNTTLTYLPEPEKH
ncbi:MAG: hypothetical protein LPJ89_04235 [Hymenobacteraceae bacterium]|nr:hypothetical protein [Hymenobacteraceae bacterium]MDX5396269.1 hypothetical protein [Hymenobacteraceae bacterium]MDX5442973.1 hypothetical protein [Hymenobacteraceae bacterium]MDX5512330.1 hypothetical protein [Hymenobacteraceae bacterium]